jgi:hypothetical protein
MKTGIIAACVATLMLATGLAQAKGGSHAIKGHTTKNGTHVAPTRAKDPNHTKSDNYSSKGNVNPASGKKGTKDPSK